MRVLVTGGTGHLGQAIVPLLQEAHHEVRILAREPRSNPGVEWVKGDLATGVGIRAAVSDVDLVIHAATNSPAAQRGRFKPRDFLGSPSDVDVEGTGALLAAAHGARVGHFAHISIVGLEHLRRLPYSRRKLEAEELVRESSVPSTILRATGFYWLLERMFANMIAQPLLALPARVAMAPCDSDEFANYVVESVAVGPGRRDDFTGPRTQTMIELMDQYLAARGLQRRIRRAPMPKKIQAALTAGNTAANARRGSTTWSQWLQRSAMGSGELRAVGQAQIRTGRRSAA